MAKASVYSGWEVLNCKHCVLDTNGKVHFVYQINVRKWGFMTVTK